MNWIDLKEKIDRIFNATQDLDDFYTKNKEDENEARDSIDELKRVEGFLFLTLRRIYREERVGSC